MYTVYNYDEDTRQYKGPSQTHEDPKHPGRPVVPANATLTAPEVTPGEHEALVFYGAWRLVPDWRAVDFWDTQTRQKVSLNLGEPPGNNLTRIEPPSGDHVWDGEDWEMPLDVAKIRKLEELAAARYETETGGIGFQGKRMHTDRDSQAKYGNAVVAFQALGVFPTVWKGIDGWMPIPDGNTLMALAAAVLTHVNACYAREEALSEQVATAETVEEVEAITWEI